MLNQDQKNIIEDAKFSGFSDYAGFKPNTQELAVFEAEVGEGKKVVITLDRCIKNNQAIHFMHITTHQYDPRFNSWNRVFGMNSDITIYIGLGRAKYNEIKFKLEDWLVGSKLSFADSKALMAGFWYRLAKDLEQVEQKAA